MPENKAENPKSALAKREEEILAFWQNERIFQKSLNKESPKGTFVFYDGPPFATGLPHFGHVLPTTLKDVVPRYKTMQGYHVPRKWGWDCHGLPVENLIEKELGLKNKKDIEDYGIEKFNAAARASVLRYADVWKEIIPRLGRWADMQNDYRTMDWTYSDSVWWSFKTLSEKGLIYEGFKAMQICPRCGTTLSNFEVNQGYKDITDISVYAKFELLDEPGTFVVAWTTTPWTLPGNVALAVNPEVEYVKVKKEGVIYVMAKELVEKVMKEEFEILETVKTTDLVGKSYKPLFEYYQNIPLKNSEGKPLTEKTGWKIYAGDFVTTTDGTGVVHIASAFGEDDLKLGQKENLPFVQHVDFEGKFKKEVTDFAGTSVKPIEDPQKADVEIIKNLAKRGLLFAKEKFIHSYPHCWRCDTPLLNYATSSWFVKVTNVKDQLVSENKKVNWIPENIGEGRFGKWLENARDWAISRSRYWGAPLPVWKCVACEKIEIIGSVNDLKQKTKRNTYFVMRHGEGEHNVQNIMSSDFEAPHHLTETGVEEATQSAQTLKDKNIDLIFASPLIRTRETADIVVKEIGFKGDIQIDHRLKEHVFGAFEGKDIEVYHSYFETFTERLSKRVPGGENVDDVHTRIAEFMYETDSKYEGKNILIITHDGPGSMLAAVAEGASDKRIIEMWGIDSDFLRVGEARLFEFARLPHNQQFALDLHRPYIDDIFFTCECGKVMKRIPEVFDTWYDSGSMPFAQNHYVGGDKAPINFPADFIAEGQDQTRGWFYSLLVLGTALFGQSPYKNVVVNGVVLAEDGQKMSKRLKNYPDLMETVNAFSADAIRYSLMSSPSVKAEDVSFSTKVVDEVTKKVLNRLQNVVSFYEMYAGDELATRESSHILDKWILARLDWLTKEMTESLDRYELDKASRPIADFVDDLSTWYLRRSRERFKGDDEKDKHSALSTTRFVLQELSKLIAPFTPFIAEDIHIKVKGGNAKESVHLESWPEVKTVDTEVLGQMAEVRKIVSLGLEARMKAAIKVRQPLTSLKVHKEFIPELSILVKDEVNVKSVVSGSAHEDQVELDTAITPELKEEGQMRELLRAIQDLRKESGLNVEDRVELTVDTDEAGKALITKFEKEISKPAGLSSITFEKTQGQEVKIDDLCLTISIKPTHS